MKLIKYWIPVVCLILVGFILRYYRLAELAGFDYDQKVAAWWIKDLLVDHKFSLIGQEISTGGVYMAPFYFYLLSIFYYIFRMNPIAADVMVTLFSLLTMLLIFLLARRLFSYKTALLSLLIYIFSFQINFYDRTTAPSNFLMMLSLTVALILNIKKITWTRGFILGCLAGLGFSIHMTAFFLIPIIFIYWLKERLPWKYWIGILSGIFIFVSPLILFELRHGFMATRNTLLILSGGLISYGAYPILFKLMLNIRTVTALLAMVLFPGYWYLPVIGLIVVILFYKYTVKNRDFNFILWLAIPLLFLSIYRLNTPEYYFLIIVPIFVIYFSNWLLHRKYLLLIFLPAFLLLNLYKLYNYQNPNALAYKDSAISYIKNNVGNQPVDLELVTDPGQNNGFLYLSYWRNLTLSKGSRLRYSIVVPKSISTRSGEIFGGIKIIKNSE